MRRNALPLIVFTLALSAAAKLVLPLGLAPQMIVEAMLTTLFPVILIEERRWNSLSRSLQQGLPHLGRLILAWSGLYAPAFLIAIFLFIGIDGPETTGGAWLGSLGISVYASLISVASLGLIMAVYRQIGDGPQDDERISDVFR